MSKPKNLFSTLSSNLKKALNSLTSRKEISEDEMNLIKGVELFQHWMPEEINSMRGDLEVVTYQQDEQIFKQGEVADAVYIIAQGSVRVYVHDQKGNKIALARLNEGDYFGEQAIIGAASKTRNANIETITNVSVIKIPAKHLLHSLKGNEALHGKLKGIGKKQAIHATLSAFNFYDELKSIFSDASQLGNIIDFTDNKIIFNQGEKPDFAYLILNGEVEILLTNKKTNNISSIILHKGQLFGEISILRDEPRLATAVAKNSLKVLGIPKKFIKEYFANSESMQQLLSTMQRNYQLPLPYHGMIEQFIGSTDEAGLSFTNFFKMEDGRTIISSMTVENNSFAMALTNKNSNKSFTYSDESGVVRKIFLLNNKIVNVESLGYWEELPNVCHLILENTTIDETWFQGFNSTGELATQFMPKVREQREMVCDCMQVSRKTLQECINTGIRDFEQLCAETRACTVCRCCKYRILEMLGENPWLSAVMKHTTEVGNGVRNYEIKLLNGSFKKFQPGQHVIIQAKVGEYWLERPYTISDTSSKTLRVTIKKEPQGAFTNWLFEAAPAEFNVYVTQPQGNFVINMDEAAAAICFAGGIGVTPFITYAKVLSEKNNKKKLHIIYFTPKASDFIFKDEFSEIMKKTPSIEVVFFDKESQGRFTEEKIAQLIESLHEPDIYICGSERFEKTMRVSLGNIKYTNDKKIHSEKFVHAGSANK